MKKKLMLVGGCICIVGVVILVVAMSILNWDFYELDATKYEQKTYAAQNEVTSLDLDVKYSVVRFERGDAVTFEYGQPVNSPYTVTEENGTIKVRSKNNAWFFRPMFNGLKGNKYPFVVTVPESVKVVKLSSEMGVTIEDLELDRLEIRCVNGGISVKNLSVTGAVDLSSTNGAVSVKELTCASLDVSSVNGRTELSDITASNGVEHSSTNGEFVFDGVECASFKTSCVNGRVRGSLTCPDVVGSTTNGEIGVTIVGSEADYRISLSTVNGKVNRADKSDGTKSVKLRSVNGSVSVYFA